MSSDTNSEALVRAFETVCTHTPDASNNLSPEDWNTLCECITRIVSARTFNVPTSYREELMFAVIERLLVTTSVLPDPNRNAKMVRSYIWQVTRSLLATSPEYKHIWKEKLDDLASDYITHGTSPEKGLSTHVRAQLRIEPDLAGKWSKLQFLGEVSGLSDDEILSTVWNHVREEILPVSLTRRTAKIARAESFDEIVELLQEKTTFEALANKHARGDNRKNALTLARDRVHRNHSVVRKTLARSIELIGRYPQNYAYTPDELEILEEVIRFFRMRDRAE